MRRCCGLDGSQNGTLARIIAGILMVGALVLSVMAGSVCEFVTYEADPNVVNSTNVPFPYNGSLDGEFGFTRYRLLVPDPNATAELEILQQDPDYNGTNTTPFIGDCKYYNNQFYDTDNYESEFHDQIIMATLTMGISVVTALLAIIFFTLECCCARFCCSRWLLCGLTILSSAGVALSFMIYQSELCTGGRTCELGLGAYLAMASASAYFTSALFIAIADKPITTAEYCCPKRFGKSKGSRGAAVATSTKKKKVKKEKKKEKKKKEKKPKKEKKTAPPIDPEPEHEPMADPEPEMFQIADDYAAYQFDDDAAGAYPISYT